MSGRGQSLSSNPERDEQPDLAVQTCPIQDCLLGGGDGRRVMVLLPCPFVVNRLRGGGGRFQGYRRLFYFLFVCFVCDVPAQRRAPPPSPTPLHNTHFFIFLEPTFLLPTSVCSSVCLACTCLYNRHFVLVMFSYIYLFCEKVLEAT